MDANSWRRRFYQTLLTFSKGAKRFVALLPRNVSAGQQSTLLILGCQRSGTTLLTRIFEHDWLVRVFNEFSELSSDDPVHGIRLNALPKVRDTLHQQRFPYIVAKPIVESQRYHQLLESLDNSKVIWLYRHFADVVTSDLNKFGMRNGIENLRPIVNKEPNNWRAEQVEESTWQVASGLFSEDMSPFDAAAIFWYCRNIPVLSARPGSSQKHSRVMLVPYELLVANPERTMGAIYDFAGWRFPGARIAAEVDSASANKTHQIQLSPEVERLCCELLAQLDRMANYQRPVQRQQ